MPPKLRPLFPLLATFICLFLFFRSFWLSAQTVTSIERISVASDGTQANQTSYRYYGGLSISGDGRYVAFASEASNLISGDTNTCDNNSDGIVDNCVDVFVRDRQTGQTTRVSIASDGTQGNQWSSFPAISADGRYVAFMSTASNLVASDTNGCEDFFVHDRVTAQTVRVSVATGGAQMICKRFSNRQIAISDDGHWAAFSTAAANLVSGDTNDSDDIFVHDLQTGETTRVSVQSNGSQYDSIGFTQASITSDGRYVTFVGYPGIYLHDRQTGETRIISNTPDGSPTIIHYSGKPTISSDGRFIAYISASWELVSGDTNDAMDVFIYDQQNDVTTRVSLASGGGQNYEEVSRPTISGDGRYVSYEAYDGELFPGDANHAHDVFVHDRQTRLTTLIPTTADDYQGNGWSGEPHISADGQTVAFYSEAANLVAGDNNHVADIFAAPVSFDSFTIVPTEATPEVTLEPPPYHPSQFIERASVTSSGQQADDNSRDAEISADGRYISFISEASNFYPDYPTYSSPTLGYVRDRLTGKFSLVTESSDGSELIGLDLINTITISGDGQTVAFSAYQYDLIDNDITPQILVRSLSSARTRRISISNEGIPGNHPSYTPTISGDGRFVAFLSPSDNLVAGDTNQCIDRIYITPCEDIFVHDLLTRQTTRVSVASDGSQGNGRAMQYPAISADGRYVAFASNSSNLVANDTNNFCEVDGNPGLDNCYDIFVHDRQTGETTRVSVASDGAQANNRSVYPVISADGRYVAFVSYADNLVSGDTNNSCRFDVTQQPIYNCADVFVHDRQTGETTRVSVSSAQLQANESSAGVAISADGRYIAFNSPASNLVAGDTNNMTDVFIHDRQTHRTALVSMTSNRLPGNNASFGASITADGRYVTFTSRADNLVPNDTNSRDDVFIVLVDFDRMASAPGVAPTRNFFLTSTPTLTWNSLSWAASYEIEIDDDKNFGSPLPSQSTNGLSLTISPIADGIWYWRVRGLNNDEAGSWSKVDEFGIDAP